MPGWGEGRDSDRVLSMCSLQEKEGGKDRKGDIMGHCFTELTKQVPLEMSLFQSNQLSLHVPQSPWKFPAMTQPG